MAVVSPSFNACCNASFATPHNAAHSADGIKAMNDRAVGSILRKRLASTYAMSTLQFFRSWKIGRLNFILTVLSDRHANDRSLGGRREGHKQSLYDNWVADEGCRSHE